MRAVIQRVSSASVTVDSEITGEIDSGLLVFLGIHGNDSERDTTWLADKIVNLRIFEDADGKMNNSLLDMGRSLLVVSQFTLYGDCRKGRRPGFSTAAPPDHAKKLYQQFIEAIKQKGVTIASGRFQAHMEVELVNDGPTTLLLDSSKLF